MKLLLPLILIGSMSSQTLANDKNVVVAENPSTKKAKASADALKEKSDSKLKKKKNINSPIKGKPKIELNKNRNKYPGIEWTPRK